MIDLTRTAIRDQYLASLGTIHACVEQAPESTWDGKVANQPYSQSVFHALFFADLYLDQSIEAMRAQAYHTRNADLFADYEQLEDRPPTGTYTKDQILDYLDFVKSKVETVALSETEASLASTVGFSWLSFSRLEMHFYNIRHLQHHAAQFILRLRLDTPINIPWWRTGFTR